MKEYDRNILALNLKKLRQDKRLSQKDFAKIFHVSQQTVGAWETGRSIPGSDTLTALADYYKVSTDQLLGRNNQTITESDLDKMLDDAKSFDGIPINDIDREVVRTFLKGRFSAK